MEHDSRENNELSLIDPQFQKKSIHIHERTPQNQKFQNPHPNYSFRAHPTLISAQKIFLQQIHRTTKKCNTKLAKEKERSKVNSQGLANRSRGPDMAGADHEKRRREIC